MAGHTVLSQKHNLFPENFTLPDLNLPGIFPEKAGGANGG